MKAVIITVLLVDSTLATRHQVNHEIVSEIKQMKTTWTPMIHLPANQNSNQVQIQRDFEAKVISKF